MPELVLFQQKHTEDSACDCWMHFREHQGGLRRCSYCVKVQDGTQHPHISLDVEKERGRHGVLPGTHPATRKEWSNGALG